MTEPLIHSHITDCLPDDHPLAHTMVKCKKCRGLVHANNNECMETWVEYVDGNFCLGCFAEYGKAGVLPLLPWMIEMIK